VKLYLYRKDTKEYFGETEARLDPLESLKLKREVFVIPPFTTPFPPLNAEKDKVNVFNDTKRIWELKEDYRGLVVYDKNGKEFIISEIGPIPSGYTKAKKYNLQEEKIKLISKVNLGYSQAQETKIIVCSLPVSLIDIGKLERFKVLLGENKCGAYDLSESETKLLSKEEAENILRYLHVRSLLLPVARKELIEQINKSRNKSQLESIKITFDVSKDTEKFLKQSEEVLNEYVKEKLQ